MNKIVQLPDDYNGILLVGKAPGADEVSSIRFNEKFNCYVGKPFIGAEGKYLRQCCRQVSFPIDQCAIINTVHEKPFKNAYETLSADAITFGREQLIETINSLKPKLIVAIGGKALEMLTDFRGINKYRGTIVKSSLVEGYRVFSTIHPDFIFKGNPQFDIVLKMDLTKALNELHSPSPDAEMNINVIYDACEARKVLYDLCFHQQPVTVDIETGGPKLLAFGVATSKTEGIVIPKDLCKDVSVLKAISEFCNSDVPKIYHNALYDVFYMAYYYKMFTRNVFADTMLAQHAIFPTLSKSLAFCASIFTNHPYWKDEGKEVTKDYSVNKIIDWSAFYIYNGKDCCVTYEVFEKQQEELDYWKTRGTYDLMMRSIPFALVSMLNGFHINPANIKAFSEVNEKTIDVLEKIKLGTIGPVNFASPKQVCELIYDNWRLPVRKNKGSRTSDDKALSYLATLPTNAQHFMGLIQTTREHLKLRGYYDIKTDPDGKVRVSQKIHGTKTGRWATSSCITGSGSNLQNQPPAVRQFYDAPQGDVFIEWDLSNVDARFVAALCEDQDWLNSFDIIDQHSFTAVNIFKLQPFYDKISTLSLETTALQSFADENGDFLAAMYKKVRENYSGGKSYRDYAKKIGHACVDAETEVLTPSGWVKACDYTQQQIYQVDVDNNGKGSFVTPDEYSIFDYSGDMFLVSNPQINQLLTPGHKLPYFNGYSLTKKPIDYLATLNSGRVHNFVQNTGNQLIDTNWLRLAIARHADGNIQPYNIVWKFKKERKIERLKQLLTDLNVEYRENFWDDATRISVKISDLHPIVIDWDYTLDQITSLPFEQLQVMSRELTKWDGYEGNTMREFTNVRKDIAENVQLMHKLSGLGNGNIQTKQFGAGAFGKGDFYVVRLNNRKYVNLGNSCYIKKQPYDGKVYNFAISSGYYLVRRNGKISVTGNTHYLEQAPKLSVTLGCSKKEAEQLIANYNILRPKLKKWHDRVRSECSQTRVIRTCFGRVIQFFGPYFNDRLPEAVASDPQSSAGDYLMTGGLNCLEQIDEITFALQVHDSIMVTVKNDLSILKKVLPKIKEIAEFDVTVRGQTFKIPIEFKVGKNWGSMKKVTLDNIDEVFAKINAQ